MLQEWVGLKLLMNFIFGNAQATKRNPVSVCSFWKDTEYIFSSLVLFHKMYNLVNIC